MMNRKALKTRSKSKKLIHNKCPSGYVKRKGYTRKNTGKHIKAICIRSTSPYSSKPATHRRSRKACPPGKAPRAGYTRKVTKANGSVQNIRVKAACVKGSSSTAKQTIGPLRKGELQRFGYSYKLPESIRQSSLRAAIKQLGALDVYRKLDAVAKLSATANPQSSRVFAMDRDWIRSNYVLQAF
jgi:hypothetical protein